MLTLRGSAYSADDYGALYYAIESAREAMSSAFCTRNFCMGCPNRHACYDLEELVDFLSRKIKENDE